MFDIVVDGREIERGKRGTGLGRILMSFLRALGENRKNVLVVSDPKTDEEKIKEVVRDKVTFVKIPFISNPIFDQVIIPALVGKKSEVFFSIYPKFPVILRFLGYKIIIFVVDLTDFTLSQKLFLRLFGKLPDKVIAISDFWKHEISRLLGREVLRIYSDVSYIVRRGRSESRKAVKLPEQGDHQKQGGLKELEDLKRKAENLQKQEELKKPKDLRKPEELKKPEDLTKQETKLGKLPEKYILYVSNFNPHKNVGVLLEAFKIVKNMTDLSLVIAGGGGKKASKDVMEKIRNTTGVFLFQNIDDDELAEIYRNSFIFVFPSLSEGQGFPPLEASYFGVPVLVSDIPVFRETMGDSAVFFDPRSPKDLAEKILRIYRNDRLRKEICERCRRVGEKFASFEIGDEIYRVIFGSYRILPKT